MGTNYRKDSPDSIWSPNDYFGVRILYKLAKFRVCGPNTNQNRHGIRLNSRVGQGWERLLAEIRKLRHIETRLSLSETEIWEMVG